MSRYPSISRTTEFEKTVCDLYLTGLRIDEIRKILRVGQFIIQDILREAKLTRPSGRNMNKTGQDNPNWKGGVRISGNGYVLIYKPDYHRAYYAPYAKRSDLVLEEKLGRLLLPNEIAHHKNEIKTDDSPDNLEVKDNHQHTQEHREDRVKRGVYKDCHILQLRNSEGKFVWGIFG